MTSRQRSKPAGPVAGAEKRFSNQEGLYPREEADDDKSTGKRKARAALAQRTMAQLLDDWDVTERLPITPELAMVRGWIMEEFERRDPDAFDCWMDNDYTQYPEKDTPRAWFTV